MQRVYSCGTSPEDYFENERHREVLADGVCPRCGERRRARRHGTYARWITDTAGQLLLILVARFLCPGCKRTISFLPSFALTYRLVSVSTVEAFLDGEHERDDVRRRGEVLRDYQRRMRTFGEKLFRVVGCGLGRAPPEAEGPWPWLKEACGDLDSAARRLVEHFRISPFGRYQCHQPARP